MVQAGFRERRKKLRNALPRALPVPGDLIVAALERAGIDPDLRAQAIGVDAHTVVARHDDDPRAEARAELVVHIADRREVHLRHHDRVARAQVVERREDGSLRVRHVWHHRDFAGAGALLTGAGAKVWSSTEVGPLRRAEISCMMNARPRKMPAAHQVILVRRFPA